MEKISEDAEKLKKLKEFILHKRSCQNTDMWASFDLQKMLFIIEGTEDEYEFHGRGSDCIGWFKKKSIESEVKQ